MPVDTKHPDYVTMHPRWKRMRDASAGQDAIHAAGECYLPKLTEETPEDYAARLKRTGWFNATWRTIEGLRGMLFRKAPVTVVSAASETMLVDVTKSGVDFNSFALKVAEEALTVGRVGVMVDYPSVPAKAGSDSLTVAQVEKLNLRPHLALYPAESIINWSTEWRTNRTVLTRVVLQESAVIPDPADEFVSTCEARWRVLDLFEDKYRVRVFRKADGGADALVSESTPTMGGQPLDFIPFQFIGTDDTTPQVDLPPLLDLVNVNIGHYQTTADLEHGAHKTALPTPYITGVTPQLDRQGNPVPLKFYTGGGSAWVLPQGATAGMLEFTGTGLGSLEKRLEVKERQMAVLGARMLEQQKSGVETAEAAGIHRSGEQSALATIGATVGKALTTVMGWFDQWAGGDGQATVTINDEFFPASLTAQDVTALVGAWQAGAMSVQEMFEKLQKGGWIRDGKEYEEHATEIDNAPPAISTNTLPLPATAQDAGAEA